MPYYTLYQCKKTTPIFIIPNHIKAVNNKNIIIPNNFNATNKTNAIIPHNISARK